MPIVDKINALTGKSAETIEDAIANMSGGGGGNVVTMTINAVGDFEVQDCSMSFDEAFSVIEDGKCLVAVISLTTDQFSMSTYGFAILSGFGASVAPSAPRYRLIKGRGYVADPPSDLIDIDVLWQQSSELPSINVDEGDGVKTMFVDAMYMGGSDEIETSYCSMTYEEARAVLDDQKPLYICLNLPLSDMPEFTPVVHLMGMCNTYDAEEYESGELLQEKHDITAYIPVVTTFDGTYDHPSVKFAKIVYSSDAELPAITIIE